MRRTCWIVERPRQSIPGDTAQRHQRVYARLRGEGSYAYLGRIVPRGANESLEFEQQRVYGY